jgi:hypothetical protein
MANGTARQPTAHPGTFKCELGCSPQACRASSYPPGLQTAELWRRSRANATNSCPPSRSAKGLAAFASAMLPPRAVACTLRLATVTALSNSATAAARPWHHADCSRALHRSLRRPLRPNCSGRYLEPVGAQRASPGSSRRPRVLDLQDAGTLIGPSQRVFRQYTPVQSTGRIESFLLLLWRKSVTAMLSREGRRNG